MAGSARRSTSAAGQRRITTSGLTGPVGRTDQVSRVRVLAHFGGPAEMAGVGLDGAGRDHPVADRWPNTRTAEFPATCRGRGRRG